MQKYKKKMPGVGVGVSDDLIVEIFTRLPPKSLLRFRSLSKWWCRCISSPDFIRNHTLSSPQKFLLRHELYHPEHVCEYIKTLYTIHSEDGLPFMCPSSMTTTEVPILFNFPYPRSAEIIGSCNGILCISERENDTISLWNPSIRHKLTLPPLPSTESWFACYGVALGFGFGFDQKSDDYKIIWINRPQKSAFVYAVKTGAWREIAYPTSRFSSFSSRGCFVNGALHWLVYLHISRKNFMKRYIMTLDLSTYVFGTIALPEPNCAAKQLTIIKGSLAVISEEPNKRWICWVRGKDHTDNTDASWYVVYITKTDPFKGIGKMFDPYEGIGKIFEMATNGNFLLGTHFTRHQVYNFETGVSSRLERLSACCTRVDFEQCVETLELLDSGTAYDENQPS